MSAVSRAAKAPTKRLLTVYVSSAIVARLDTLSGLSGAARGVVLEALLTHGVECACQVCAADR